MKKMTYFMVLLVCFYIGCSVGTKKQPVDFVDPFICTEGDHGHWHPSALVPFGQIKLGPDTYPSSLTGDGDWAHSGYNYADNEVRGFSHFHRGSSGGGSISDRAGNFSFFPFVESIEDISLDNPVIGFDKSTQKAQAGYYTVTLNNGILVELPDCFCPESSTEIRKSELVVDIFNPCIASVLPPSTKFEMYWLISIFSKFTADSSVFCAVAVEFHWGCPVKFLLTTSNPFR